MEVKDYLPHVIIGTAMVATAVVVTKAITQVEKEKDKNKGGVAEIISSVVSAPATLISSLLGAF